MAVRLAADLRPSADGSVVRTPLVAGGGKLQAASIIITNCEKHFIAFSALTLLAGRQEGHPACKKMSGGVLA